MVKSQEKGAEKYIILKEANVPREKLKKILKMYHRRIEMMVEMSFPKKIWKKGRIGKQSER